MEKMTEGQEAHLKRIKDRFSALVDPKYRKGQESHGGDLFTVPTLTILDMAIEEAIDQVVYLITLRDRLIGE